MQTHFHGCGVYTFACIQVCAHVCMYAPVHGCRGQMSMPGVLCCSLHCFLRRGLPLTLELHLPSAGVIGMNYHTCFLKPVLKTQTWVLMPTPFRYAISSCFHVHLQYTLKGIASTACRHFCYSLLHTRYGLFHF